MKIIIELKRDVNANVVLNQLYKHTQMQDTFGVIMLCLVDGEPKVLNLREMLYNYCASKRTSLQEGRSTTWTRPGKGCTYWRA